MSRLFKFFKRLHEPKKNILTQVQEYFKEEYGVNVSVEVHIHTIHNNYTKEEAIEMGKRMAEKENMPVHRLNSIALIFLLIITHPQRK